MCVYMCGWVFVCCRHLVVLGYILQYILQYATWVSNDHVAICNGYVACQFENAAVWPSFSLGVRSELLRVHQVCIVYGIM